MLSAKVAILAIAFVVTGGAVFSDWFRRNIALATCAAIVAIVGSYYLFVGIIEDLRDVASRVETNFTEDQVRSAAVKFLFGDPYGRTEEEVERNIVSVEFFQKGLCGYGPNWAATVFVPQGDKLNNQSITGIYHFWTSWASVK
jgi:hypothetical protein